AAPGGKGWKNIRNGAVLQCAEAITLGMPLEVWKTHMGRYRSEATLEAFWNIHKQGGGGISGVAAFWKGSGPKMVESASKGAVLIYAKEAIAESCTAVGVEVACMLLRRAGKLAQQVTGNSEATVMNTITRTWKERGVLGFYPGGVAIAFRQATNWASRQVLHGFTDAVRNRFKLLFHGDSKAKLTMPQEALAGLCGGILSCWNHPFEVARIEMQARAAAGQSSLSMLAVFQNVHREYGIRGLFQACTSDMFLWTAHKHPEHASDLLCG
ncbi:MAG: hypothetical protein SGPRY_009846, partial [Prymnesium sp.]